MTNEEKLYFAGAILGTIKHVKVPAIMYDEEKEVVREALLDYIRKVEDTMRGR